MGPLDFCRSVNPISTRRWRLCPPHHYWHPRIFWPSYGPEYKRLLDELQLQKHGFPYLEENKKDRWEKFVSKMDHYATCMQEIKNFFCMFAFHYNSSLKEGIPRKLQLEQARILIKKTFTKLRTIPVVKKNLQKIPKFLLTTIFVFHIFVKT